MSEYEEKVVNNPNLKEEILKNTLKILRNKFIAISNKHKLGSSIDPILEFIDSVLENT